jgi:hypothetical protein
MSDLRKKLIRLAYEKPELRPQLLSLLKEAKSGPRWSFNEHRLMARNKNSQWVEFYFYQDIDWSTNIAVSDLVKTLLGAEQAVIDLRDRKMRAVENLLRGYDTYKLYKYKMGKVRPAALTVGGSVMVGASGALVVDTVQKVFVEVNNNEQIKRELIKALRTAK